LKELGKIKTNAKNAISIIIAKTDTKILIHFSTFTNERELEYVCGNPSSSLSERL
jgi:hypothetical protein